VDVSQKRFCAGRQLLNPFAAMRFFKFPRAMAALRPAAVAAPQVVSLGKNNEAVFPIMQRGLPLVRTFLLLFQHQRKTNKYPCGMNTLLRLFFACALLLAVACTPTEKKKPAVSGWIKYAKGFSVAHESGYTRVTVQQPYPGATAGHEYWLAPAGATTPPMPPRTTRINIPVKKIVCTSTTHIPLLDYLGETGALVGFPTTGYISSEKMRRRIDSGLVADLGIDRGMNLERLLFLQPDLLMAYTLSGDLGQLKKIQEAGIPVALNAEYLEPHPLGRAEWIKFMALFFQKEKTADSVFAMIEREYLSVAAVAGSVTPQPTVLTGILYGDTWFLPGGKNHAAQLMHDAGLHYLWREDASTDFLKVSFELVFLQAAAADLWIGVGAHTTMQTLLAAEPRYALFAAVKNKSVYTYNARQGATGGSQFLELGYLRPDLILKDLVKIGHPGLLPQHDLFFYAALR
jgi:iron complex transport system substrate-binding protein